MSLEQQFRNAVIDRQVDDLMRNARNIHQLQNNRMMVPSNAELQYIHKSAPPDLPTAPKIQIPSSAVPVATPNTSAAQRFVAPNSPRPASPPTPINQPNPAPGAKPPALPIPVGNLSRFAPSAGMALLDFGFRLGYGQSVDQAAAGGAGNFVGGAVGTVVGNAVAGPVGGVVGGAVGGAVGGRIADLIWDLTRPKPTELPTEQVVGKLPFPGGQGQCVPYGVRFRFTSGTEDGVAVYGPIGGIRIRLEPAAKPVGWHGTGDYYIGYNEIFCRGEYSIVRGLECLPAPQWVIIGQNPGQSVDQRLEIISVQRIDNKPDTDGNPPPLPIPQDNRALDTKNHPLNQTSAPPRATPQTGNPQTSPSAPQNYVPGGTPSRTGGSPRGDSPDWIPHAAPKGSPHPDTMRPLIGPPLPNVGRQPTPPITPEIRDINQAIPNAQNPGTGTFGSPTPIELKFPSAAPVTTTVGNEPIPDAINPTPKTNNPPGTGTKPAQDPLDQKFQDIEKLFRENYDNRFKEMAGGLAALTPILTQLQQNTAPQNLENIVEKGTCKTTQPGGCTGKEFDAIKNNQQSTNQKLDDLLKGADATAQAAQLALLNTINTKLGPQVVGGISGFLQKFAKSIHLDKILNALTLITSLHNAAMLSRNLGSTLGELTGQALEVIGIKDENGSAIDINGILSKQANSFMESLIGAETWQGIKITWNKANNILASASQIVWTVRSLFDSGREILEWTAENTGRIGNALKRFRVVGENAYRWMPERVTATNAWALKVDRARQNIDSLDDAASSFSGVLGEVQNIQQEAQELREQKERFDKNLKEFTPKDREDNEPVKAAVAAAKTASKAPEGIESVFRGEGESEDA